MMLYLLVLQGALYFSSMWAFKGGFHPAVLMSALWLVVLGGTLLGGYDYYFSAEAYFVIFLFQFLFFLGAFIQGLVGEGCKGVGTRISIVVPGVRLILWSSLIFGALAVLVTLKVGGVSLGSASAAGIAELSRSMSIARYTEAFRMPLLASLMQMVVFFACAISGFQYASPLVGVKRVEYFLPILALMSISIVLTTRATVLFGVTMFLAAFISGRLVLGRYTRFSFFTFKNIVLASLGLLLVAAFFVSLQFLRGGITDLSRLTEVLEHLRKWPFGSIAGYSLWYDSMRVVNDVSYGYFTFTGIYDQLGIRSRESGLYTDYVNLGGGAFGNIYTVFRGIVEDFGFFGGFAVFFLMGWWSSSAYRHVIGGSVGSVAFLMATYCFILWSPIVSFYAYTGHVVAFIGFWFFLKFFKV